MSYIQDVSKRPGSVELEAPGHGVDLLREVRPNGQARLGRHPSELGLPRVGNDLGADAGSLRSLGDGQQLLLAVHPDADLGEEAFQLRAFGGSELLPGERLLGEECHGGVGALGDLLPPPHLQVLPHHDHLLYVGHDSTSRIRPPGPGFTMRVVPTWASFPKSWW